MDITDYPPVFRHSKRQFHMQEIQVLVPSLFKTEPIIAVTQSQSRHPFCDSSLLPPFDLLLEYTYRSELHLQDPIPQ